MPGRPEGRRPADHRRSIAAAGLLRVDGCWGRLAILARGVSVVGSARHVRVRAMVTGLAAGPAPAAVVVAAVRPISGYAVLRPIDVRAVIGAVVGFTPA